MKIYLDNSCLNRPFDDQSQARIRLESEAVALIFNLMDSGVLRHVASQVSLLEAAAAPDPVRRQRVLDLLPAADGILILDDAARQRARWLVSVGLKPADAFHVAAAEAAKVDAFLTCDDRLLRACARLGSELKVVVANPIDWIRSYRDVPDFG